MGPSGGDTQQSQMREGGDISAREAAGARDSEAGTSMMLGDAEERGFLKLWISLGQAGCELIITGLKPRQRS